MYQCIWINVRKLEKTFSFVCRFYQPQLAPLRELKPWYCSFHQDSHCTEPFICDMHFRKKKFEQFDDVLILTWKQYRYVFTQMYSMFIEITLHYISYYQIFSLCNLGDLRSVQCTVGYIDFNNLFLLGCLWLQNLILRHIYIKKCFHFFSRFICVCLHSL